MIPSLFWSVKGTSADWKQFLHDLLAMFKQLGIPKYFLTLVFVNLRWGKTYVYH